MYSLFSQNTFQRTPNHHFGWTIRHFFLTTARTKYRSENPWPPRSSLLGLHRAASPRIPARSTPGADTAVGGPACWRWETVAYNREAVHSGRSAAVLLQSCKYIYTLDCTRQQRLFSAFAFLRMSIFIVAGKEKLRGRRQQLNAGFPRNRNTTSSLRSFASQSDGLSDSLKLLYSTSKMH